MKMKVFFYIEGFAAWYIVKASNARKAYLDGLREFGRGMVKNVREASEAEVEHFIRLKGEIGEAG